MKRTLTSVLVASALMTLAAAPAMAAVSDKDIESDAKTSGDVLSWGLGTQGQRYSPLDKINTKNVKDLVRDGHSHLKARNNLARNCNR